MATQYAPQIITNGLVLALDAGNTKSYPGTGTTWFDKSGNNYNGTFFNGPVFNTGSLGNIVFDGTDDSCRLTLSSQLSNSFTFCAFVKPTINPDNPAGIVISEEASYNNYWASLGLFQQKWH